jgi:hypothetical protein
MDAERGGLLAPPAPASALRLTFERVVWLDSPATVPATVPAESQEACGLPDLLDALPPGAGAGFGFGMGGCSQDPGLFWCAAGARARRRRRAQAAETRKWAPHTLECCAGVHADAPRLRSRRRCPRSTPDFITPQDHQFAIAYNTTEKARCRREAAAGLWCRDATATRRAVAGTRADAPLAARRRTGRPCPRAGRRRCGASGRGAVRTPPPGRCTHASVCFERQPQRLAARNA